jgi:hypothetical protein
MFLAFLSPMENSMIKVTKLRRFKETAILSKASIFCHPKSSNNKILEAQNLLC